MVSADVQTVCESSRRWQRHVGDMLRTDRNLEVNKFLGESAHLVVEAKLVLAGLVGGKDEVPLAFSLAIHNVFAVRAGNLVVNIEGTSGLHLERNGKC